MNFFSIVGEYMLLMKLVFTKPDHRKLFWRQLVVEFGSIGLSSLGIVLIISAFIGAVVTIQTAYNMTNPLFPDYLVGLSTRDISLLEFSSTVMCLILAGKIGSNVASEIGTMKVTEQIDALEIMGINSANYLILPKIVAALLTFPLMALLSMFVSIVGGWFAGVISGEVPSADYIYGIQRFFIPYYVVYSLVKVITYAFIITSVSSYYGYSTEGGALEVGKSSTKAVVGSSMVILVFDLILTTIML